MLSVITLLLVIWCVQLSESRSSESWSICDSSSFFETVKGTCTPLPPPPHFILYLYVSFFPVLSPLMHSL